MSNFEFDNIEFDKIDSGSKPSAPESGKIGPRDIVINIIASILLLVVVSVANGFMSGEFDYKQVFGWNMGVLVIINWMCGIGFSYTLRQIGVKMGMGTKEYTLAEAEKQDAFSRIMDYTVAQKNLDEKIDRDFAYRKSTLEKNIAKLVQHKMPAGEVWEQGMPLPKKTKIKIKIMVKYLDRMTPPQISLIQLAEAETSVVPKSLFDIPSDPGATGAKWFMKKGAGKLVFFAAVPILLSLVASALLGGITFGSFIIIAGTLAAMLFNGAKSLTTSYYAITRKGVARLRRITRILKLVT